MQNLIIRKFDYFINMTILPFLSTIYLISTTFWNVFFEYSTVSRRDYNKNLFFSLNLGLKERDLNP